ncbi:MAG: phage tail protein [Myxococcales bacterium]|nr:phage tail protein [Myxococcales bacterium]
MSTATQRSRYPVMAYNFRVTVGSSTASFAEVSGLKREFETVTYRHGLSFREGEDITKYYLAKYEPITLRRGVFRGAASLYDWVDAKEDTAITIALCDELGYAVIEWKIERAVVKKIDAPSFDAKAGEVAVDSIEVMAAGISIRELPEVAVDDGAA